MKIFLILLFIPSAILPDGDCDLRKDIFLRIIEKSFDFDKKTVI